jgi:hypothetical protein
MLWFVWPQALPATFLPLALLTAVRASARYVIWRRHLRLTPA